MQFHFNKIQHLASLPQCIFFQHVSRSIDRMADSLAKQGVDRTCNLSALVV